MKNKYILSFLLTFICLLSLPFSAFAAEYGTDYPAYVNYSGGAYIEIQSSVGRGTIVLSDAYKIGYLGFYGANSSICNLSSSNLNGKFITSNGNEYNLRLNSFSTPQYYYESGVNREWRNLNVTKIYNTNCEFLDYSEHQRDNKLDIFNNNPFYYTVVGLLIILVIMMFFVFLKGKKYAH